MKRFIVWTNYGSYEGWHYVDADTWEEAVVLRDSSMSSGNSDVVITELCPVVIKDGRHAE